MGFESLKLENCGACQSANVFRTRRESKGGTEIRTLKCGDCGAELTFWPNKVTGILEKMLREKVDGEWQTKGNHGWAVFKPQRDDEYSERASNHKEEKQPQDSSIPF